MSADLISKKTRYEFREFLVGFVLRDIEKNFDAAGVNRNFNFRPSISGQRRGLVEQYYHTVNWSDWRDVKKVLEAYEYFLHASLKLIKDIPESETWVKARKESMEDLIGWLIRDGFQWVEGRIVTAAGMPSLDNIKETASEFDAKHLFEQIRRIEQSVETDPALAIGTSKELIETCCKTILTQRGKPVTGTPNIPQLTKETLKELKLLPDDIPEAAKGSEVIKRLLSNLATIGQGLAEIRGLYGTGHGKDGKAKSIKPRHAKLAVGAAATLATFLFETHKETDPSSTN